MNDSFDECNFSDTMKFSLNFYLLLASLLGHSIAFQTLVLNSGKNKGWIVNNENKSIQVAAHVPGGIYSDLKNNQILAEDIYYRSNDELYRWVAYDNWTYSLNFSVPKDWLPESNKVLVFHGVDSVAEILLNGITVNPKLDNMFVRHVLNVTGILQLENQLVVHLVSPVWAANQRSKQWPQVVPDCVPSSYHGECHVNLLRKTQASFAWDWGPAFPSLGIWKDVELVTYNGAILRDVTVDLERDEIAEPYKAGLFWRATFVLHLEALVPGAVIDGFGRVVLYLENGNETGTTSIYNEDDTLQMSQREIFAVREVKSRNADENGEFQIKIHLNIPEEQISLWWPNGLGSQPLYTAVATFTANGDRYSEVTSMTLKIGFRTVELVQDPIGENGLSFYLKVNGIPVFAKGSNWIPPYALPEWSATKSGEEMTRDLLLSAKEIGINMLRVWGGGSYESDYFYDLADELGILIWQDMMFACSMYPVVPDFLDSVALEVAQQVRRLQHHPSIVLWAGNNENEAALRQNWYGTASNFTSYLRDYALLYGGVIRNSVLSVAPSSIFVISSPSNGLESMGEEGFVAKNPQSTFFGDIHYYNYFADGWNPYIYPLPRFASEYGFQSLPSMETLRSAGATSGDWGTKTDFFLRRQHHLLGYQEMSIEIKRHLLLPPTTESEEGMTKFVYLSQINQAMGLKVETEAYRRGKGRSEPGNNGTIEGGTMGALYWQLNDIWQAPSWSTIEYGGRWKMAHYFAAKFFSNLLASPLVTIDDQLQVFILSDIASTSGNGGLSCSLVIRVYSWESPCPIGIKSVDVTVPPLSADLAFTTELETFLNSSGCNGTDIDSLKRSCFLTFDLKFHDYMHEVPTNLIFLASPKDAVGLKRANVTVTSVSDPFPTQDPGLKDHYPYSAEINISSDGVALFVWLEAFGIKGRFSDNGFLLAANEKDLTCSKALPGKELFDEDVNSTHVLDRAPTNVHSDNVKSQLESDENLEHGCPFNCSEMDNTIVMAICCTNIGETGIVSSPVIKFSQTLTFYFQEENVNSSTLHEVLTIAHLMD